MQTFVKEYDYYILKSIVVPSLLILLMKVSAFFFLYIFSVIIPGQKISTILFKVL